MHIYQVLNLSIKGNKYRQNETENKHHKPIIYHI